MASYKDTIYNNYVSNHNKNLYGDNSIEKIRAKFPAWNFYFSSFLPAGKTARILDIGCGDGNFVYWLHSLGYTEACGIDISKEQVDAGHKTGIRNLYHGDLNEFLEQQQGGFDMVIARDVMEHFTKDEVFRILALVNRNLKQGGSFLIQSPNGQGYFYTSIFYGDFTHEIAFTASSINQIALNTGYSKTACYPVGPAPTGVVSRIRYLLWKIKVLQLRFWKMVETGNSKGIFTQNLIALLTK